MTKYQKITILISLVAIVFSTIATGYIFYYDKIHKEEHLSIVPVKFYAIYDDAGWSYESSIAFVNRGNVEIIIKDYSIDLSIPTTDAEYPAAGHSDLWKKDPIILKPNATVILHHSTKENWPFYFKPGPNVQRSRVGFHFSVISVAGKELTETIPIVTRNDSYSFQMLDVQIPRNETFDKSSPSAPKLKLR